MPPRGYRDELKRWMRELLSPEERARGRVARGRERDLTHLLRIATLCASCGVTVWAAAGIVAEELGGAPQPRHATRKRLYGKYQKAPALYWRLASASEDPEDAADREICEELGFTFRPRTRKRI
jgi:hypothetical protein